MRPAVIFVDLQEDFFANPPLSECRASIVDAVNDLAQFCHANAWPIIWIRQEFESDLSDAFLSMRESGMRITIRGTSGCELIREIRVNAGDHEIVKHRYSAFFDTRLEVLLKSLSPSHVVIGGVNTHACVRATAVDAYQRDYRVVLATDTISSYDSDYHRESMRWLAQSIGVPMKNAEIKEVLRAA